MEKLALSLPPRTALSNALPSSIDQPPTQAAHAQYAAERARLLFGQYRSGEANDPETYIATVAVILATYPAETIRYVTDPLTGMATNPLPDQETGRVWTGMPNPADVKRACENHYGPTRRAIERRNALKKQFEERDEYERSLRQRASRPAEPTPAQGEPA